MLRVRRPSKRVASSLQQSAFASILKYSTITPQLDGTMSAEATADSMETKKLRSGWEPDLKVWVGGEQGGDKTVLFHHHSLLLATHSDYIDTMLASSMLESESRSLSFPDIEPPVWQKMLALLEDPLEGRQMDVDDALQVFPFYDKYQFPKGIKLCDHVFHEFVAGFDGKDIPAASVDTVIDVSVMADRVATGKAKKVCLRHLQAMITCSEYCLTEEEINKLIPLITKEQLLLDAIGMTKEELLSPLLHRYWQTRHQLLVTSKQLYLTGDSFRDISCRREKGSLYKYISATVRVAGNSAHISVERDEAANWTVGHRPLTQNSTKTVVWICPQSKHLDVPPCEGWIVFDDSIHANGEFGPLKIRHSS